MGTGLLVRRENCEVVVIVNATNLCSFYWVIHTILSAFS